MLVYNGVRGVHISNTCSKICAIGVNKNYLTCNPGKCCEFRVICPCIVQKVQNLRHSLYISWSSLDGLLVCLLLVRIQQISRDSRELWENCAKSG